MIWSVVICDHRCQCVLLHVPPSKDLQHSTLLFATKDFTSISYFGCVQNYQINKIDSSVHLCNEWKLHSFKRNASIVSTINEKKKQTKYRDHFIFELSDDIDDEINDERFWFLIFPLKFTFQVYGTLTYLMDDLHAILLFISLNRCLFKFSFFTYHTTKTQFIIQHERMKIIFRRWDLIINWIINWILFLKCIIQIRLLDPFATNGPSQLAITNKRIFTTQLRRTHFQYC